MKKILVLCSPSPIMLDNWFPILFKLKSDNNQINIFFPKIPSINQLLNNKFYKESSEKIFSNVFYTQKSKLITDNKIRFQHVNLFKKISKKLSEILIKYFDKEFDIYNFLNQYFISTKEIDYSDVLKDVDLILCDIREYNKKYLSGFFEKSKKIKIVSMAHGTDFPYPPNEISYNDLSNKEMKNINVILFSNTIKEKEFYYSELNTKNINFQHFGNPKHDPEWISGINESNKNIRMIFPPKKYVFLISRNSDKGYLPSERKIEYIKFIKKILIDQLDLKIIVKLHPRELHEIYYEKIFLKKDYNKTWTFTEEHPFTVAKNCLFSISYYSGMIVDLLKLGIPNIEILNLKGLEKLTSNMIFSNNGNPILKFRKLGFTLGCSNEREFIDNVQDLMQDKDRVLNNLVSNYKKVYNLEVNSINEIKKFIDRLK